MVVLIGIAFLLLRYLLLPMTSSHERTALIVCTVLIALVGALLLIFAMRIPSTASHMLTSGIERVEAWYNTNDPEASHRELDKAQLTALLSDAHSVNAYLEKNQHIDGLVQWVGMRIFVDYIETFASSIDNHLVQFEEQGVPFTLHNILAYTQEQARDSLCAATRVIAFSIWLLVMLLFGVVCIVYYAIQKECFKSSAVTYGSGTQV